MKFFITLEPVGMDCVLNFVCLIFWFNVLVNTYGQVETVS